MEWEKGKSKLLRIYFPRDLKEEYKIYPEFSIH